MNLFNFNFIIFFFISICFLNQIHSKPIEHERLYNFTIRTKRQAISNEPINLPEHFDARTHWPACRSTIDHINDQDRCGNCWAISTTDMLSDRICIASRGRIRVRIATWYLQTCCGVEHCGTGSQRNGGCRGGSVEWGLEYFVNYGLATEQCQPKPRWLSGYNRYYGSGFEAVCVKNCQNPFNRFENHLFYGKSVIYLPNNETEIRREIYQNGPVLGIFYASDFGDARGSRIHSCPEHHGRYVQHAARLIGWGTEHGGRKYWIAANTWGKSWSDYGGFYKIARGENTCKLEDTVFTATVKI